MYRPEAFRSTSSFAKEIRETSLRRKGDFSDDILPFVSREGHLVGYGSREEAEARKGIILVVRPLVFNSHGEVLLQKRSHKKKEYPGLYSGSASGHVNYLIEQGRIETEDEASRRELNEELGIDATHLPFVEGFTENEPMKNGGIKRVTTRAYFHNGHFLYNEDEIAGLEWVNLRVLQKRMIDNPEDYTPGLTNFMQTKVFPDMFGKDRRNVA